MREVELGGVVEFEAVGDLMDNVELVLVTLLVAVVGLRRARAAVDVPYPIVLVIGGLVMGFVPGPAGR